MDWFGYRHPWRFVRCVIRWFPQGDSDGAFPEGLRHQLRAGGRDRHPVSQRRTCNGVHAASPTGVTSRRTATECCRMVFSFRGTDVQCVPALDQ